MYGTIARFHVKPGMAEQFLAFVQRESTEDPGQVAEYFYRLDTDPNTYYMVVVFESKAAYVANAQRPETNARYTRGLEHLASEPEWHDGEVVFTIT